MSTDFFDSDLRSEPRGPILPVGDAVIRPADTISSRAISKLVEQKQERTTQMAGAVQEIELLRQRQRELELEKEKLEQLARKQEIYEKNKREVVGQLDRSLLQFEKQAAEAMQAADLIATVRRTYEECLQEVQLINENSWGGQNFEDDLNRALAVVEEAQTQYKKGMSKVSAHSWFRPAGPAEVVGVEPSLLPTVPSSSFLFWLKAGTAFCLPLVLVVVICFVVWLVTSGTVP
jgi:hypothetical protein